MPPNFCRPKANCVDITMPMNRLVTVTIPIDATPSDSSCRTISRPSKGLRNSARMQLPNSVVTSPSWEKNAVSVPITRTVAGGGGARHDARGALGGPLFPLGGPLLWLWGALGGELRTISPGS